MNKTTNSQKKNLIYTYIYATIIGLLIISVACAIAFMTRGEVKNNSNTSVEVASAVYVVPMKNATIIKDYSGSELQYNDTMKQWEIHRAVDFLSGEDRSVMAITDGTISNVYTNYLEGTVVEISHKNGLVSIYKSLESSVVSIGDKVIAGQVIGTAGETMAQELNSKVHLHLEMKVNGNLVNPNDYIDLGIK